ncbi:ATP-binding protein [Paraliomyxa miuraensis]|uniref:ATP-binding protein n=1 Tax=Paraliomyxa miuraensis TaxID=376150 RepID=UPI00225A87B5|nr:ATP-binding protein [Paraliomyxa miuraensis]MCX4240380.1 ATP-binding protein [Paraliomyxa miuraensis]
MADEHAGTAKTVAVTSGGEAATGSSGLPGWFPDWGRRLAELYFSGTTSMFVLHGNTDDLVRSAESGGQPRFVPLTELVATQLFGRWDLVLYYDLSTGLRVVAGPDAARQKDMATLAQRRIGALETLPKDPTAVLHVLDRFIHKNVMAETKDRLSVAIVLGHASYVAPRGDKSLKSSTHVVTLLNWAASPYVKRLNTAFVLIDGVISELSERLAGSPHVATLDVPLPDSEARLSFLKTLTADRDPTSFSDYGLPELAELTAGISLTDLRVLVTSTIEAGRRLDAERFRELKKTLIERQAGGLLEFIEPRWGLDMVIGHDAAKKRLQDDAALLHRGAVGSVPMGYLLCGPVGTGKSFLAQCAAGTLGIPCVELKSFRSKYVGESEGNLARVLGVLRSMGPVMVIVDEADAMLGDRQSGGDSGVGSRIFGMIARQMGDTRYRGKILWMLLTTRPDFLPIDLKRQGRAEVHIPLFYPTDEQEIRKTFVVLARKVGAKLAEADVPPVGEDKRGQLSGADIEGIVGRAWRNALIAGHDHITAEGLAAVLDGFIPMAQSLERELQTLAAIIECTDKEFLPPAIEAKTAALGGRAKVQERLNQIKAVVDGS